MRLSVAELPGVLEAVCKKKSAVTVIPFDKNSARTLLLNLLFLAHVTIVCVELLAHQVGNKTFLAAIVFGV